MWPVTMTVPETLCHTVLRENAKARTAKSTDKQDFVESWYWLMVRAGELSDRFKFWYYVLTWLTTVFAATVPTLIGFTGLYFVIGLLFLGLTGREIGKGPKESAVAAIISEPEREAVLV